MPNKKNIESVKILTEKIKNAKSIVMLNYKGIDCLKLNKLRKLVRNTEDSEYIVAKNTLFKIALKNAKIDENLDTLLKGPTSFIFSYSDVLIAPRISKDFKSESDVIEIKGGLIDKKLMSGEYVQKISMLPSKEVLIAKLMMLMKSPLAKLHFILDKIKDSEKKD